MIFYKYITFYSLINQLRYKIQIVKIIISFYFKVFSLTIDKKWEVLNLKYKS